MASLDQRYHRICPVCGARNQAENLRCACGALLLGVDLTADEAELQTPEPHTHEAEAEAPPSTPLICPYADCAQANPVGQTLCVYCNRSLFASPEAGLALPEVALLMRLPRALREHYDIVRRLESIGAEADLFVVAPLAGGEERVAKIYRHGIHPDRAVSERIAKIERHHRVEIFDAGISDGFAYELMEFCRLGSLRDLLRQQAPNTFAPDFLRILIAELASAISDVHRVGLIHRDLKPENVLLRSLPPRAPLDLVLTDFGVAKLQNATVCFTGLAHTLAYSAPESLSGVIDRKADYWSLGMIVLECTLGVHPFAGLSDAVILHALTTQAVDLSGVLDTNVQKLLRGLLQRKPAARWAHEEIERWLANDPSLPDAPGESSGSAGQPYQIGAARCFTSDQLAVALATHWSLALQDLDNGLLLQWFRHELKDQNHERFLLSWPRDSAPVDVRLLRLILNLAPGIPPVWRGESLTVRDILARASRALKNDADATVWLADIYSLRVLEAYADAGNEALADVLTRWCEAWASFQHAWRVLLDKIKHVGQRQVSVEAMLYGQSEPACPSARHMHARLLAVVYDERWGHKLREALQTEVARVSLNCSWLDALGDVAQMSVFECLVVEKILPLAQQEAQQTNVLATRARDALVAELALWKSDLAFNQANLLQLVERLAWWDDSSCPALCDALDQRSGLVARIRAAGRSDADYLALCRSLGRSEPLLRRLRECAEALSERRLANRGWFSREVLSAFGTALFFIPWALRRYLTPILLILLLGVTLALWRSVPLYFLRRDIRNLSQRLEAQGLPPL